MLYLTSDLALSRNGMPVLMPAPEDFGLPPTAKVDLGRTFIRTRKYSPWNSFFNCRMTERNVISRGSVICFTNCSDEDRKKMVEYVSAGVGLYREEGLGQILINPSFVINPPTLSRHRPNSPVAVTQQQTPQTLLARYASRKMVEERHSLDDAEKGKQLAKDLIGMLGKLEKRYSRAEVPGKTQWKNVYQIAMSYKADDGMLMRELEKYMTEDLRRRAWNEKKIGNQSLYEYIQQSKNDDRFKDRFGYAFVHAVKEVIAHVAAHREGR